MPLHEVERLFQLNTLGALRVTQAVLPVMRSRGSARVNAGHLAPLLIRDRRVVRALENPGTLPVGFGGATPQISEQLLRRGDRVLFFTDGAIEEHKPGGEQFGQERLIEFVERAGRVGEGVQEMVRSLSHSLTRARGGATTDDATLFLVEWRGGSADHLAALEVLPRRQTPDPVRDHVAWRCLAPTPAL